MPRSATAASAGLPPVSSTRWPRCRCRLRLRHPLRIRHVLPAHRAGKQIEQPDNWLRYGSPGSFRGPRISYPGEIRRSRVSTTTSRTDAVSVGRYRDVMAMAFDTPMPGFGNDTVNNMRLWSAKASREFNFEDFNEGDYIKAVEQERNPRTSRRCFIRTTRPATATSCA